MGASLKPTAAMTPWYSVEANTSHAELTATAYALVSYLTRAERGTADYTDEERAGAWLAIGPATFATPAAPLTALLAALDQIIQHPTYTEWQATDGKATPFTVNAHLRPDGRLQITAPFFRHPEDRDGDHIPSVELLYADVAPLRLTVLSLI